jgi:hypothetical protein
MSNNLGNYVPMHDPGRPNMGKILCTHKYENGVCIKCKQKVEENG